MIFRILFFELKAGMHSFALDVMSTSESSQRREIGDADLSLPYCIHSTYRQRRNQGLQAGTPRRKEPSR
jgi:hypothetical protein